MMTVQDILIEAVTIAAVLKLLMSIEDWFAMRQWLSVRLEDQLGPLVINIKDENGSPFSLLFNSLSDYRHWIKNHISAANKVIALEEETDEPE